VRAANIAGNVLDYGAFVRHINGYHRGAATHRPTFDVDPVVAGLASQLQEVYMAPPQPFGIQFGQEGDVQNFN
jgi:hypothetical protein